MKVQLKPVFFVFVTVMLDAVGIGLIFPVMPDLLQELSDLPVGQAAIWGGYLTFSYALMQFIFSPVLGALSDRVGRRPILMISLLALAVDYLIMAAAGSLVVLFLGRVVAGIAGATYSTATAYIADVTPRENRAAAFGLVGAAFGVGFVLGPVLGALLGELGTRAPFIAAAAIAFGNLAYGYFLLPESLPLHSRRRFEWRRANPFGAFLQITKLPMVGWFVVVSFLYSLSHNVYPAIWAFYGTEMFDWSVREIGLSLAAVGFGFAVVQGWLIKYILAWLGERLTAYLGFCLNVLSMVGLGFATESWMVFLLIPLTALGDIVSPALTGLMSNRTDDDAQGELQGVIASAMSVTAVISPILMTQVFGAFTTPPGLYLPGAPFLIAAAIMVLAAWIFHRALRAGP